MSPCTPTVERVDLESIQWKFESSHGHLNKNKNGRFKFNIPTLFVTIFIKQI